MSDRLEDGMTEVWVLPCLSQEFAAGPVAKVGRGTLELRYDFETEVGDYGWASVSFRGVIAALFTDHESCSEAQVAAYDRLVEVDGSEWLEALQATRIERARAVRHLRIYFDEIGCYDIAATTFEPPAESGP